MAQVTFDTSQIVTTLGGMGIVAGITAIAVIKIAPAAAKWGYNKLTSMFGG